MISLSAKTVHILVILIGWCPWTNRSNVDVFLQNAHHHLDEASGAGSAFVVHNKVHHIQPIVQQDGFAVLTADVHDCANIRVQKSGSSGMAGDFGDLLICLFQQRPAISGGYGVGNVIIIQHLVQIADAVLWVCGGGQDCRLYNLSPIKQRTLGRSRSRVDSKCQHGLQHLDECGHSGIDLTDISGRVVSLDCHVRDTLFLVDKLFDAKGFHIVGMAGLQGNFDDCINAVFVDQTVQQVKRFGFGVITEQPMLR